MKTCCACKQERPLTDFWKNKSRKDGLCIECKNCGYIRGREDYIRNREAHHAKRREYYSKPFDVVLYRKRHGLRHKEIK